jgi:hypothetical protein
MIILWRLSCGDYLVEIILWNGHPSCGMGIPARPNIQGEDAHPTRAIANIFYLEVS